MLNENVKRKITFRNLELRTRIQIRRKRLHRRKHNTAGASGKTMNLTGPRNYGFGHIVP